MSPVNQMRIGAGRAKTQQGAALVVAMLILSVVVILAASLTMEHSFNIRRIANVITQEQAYQYLRATEAIAHKALWEDAKKDAADGKRVDGLDDYWAQEAPPFILEDGAYTGKVIDLQGRFNINSLQSAVASDGNYVRPPNTAEQGIFIRLLLSLSDDDYQVSVDQAQNITEAIVDWVDSDSDPRGFECGEDDAYYSIEGRKPHRTANQPFYSVSELRLICNMPLALFYRLEPFVTVWPLSGQGSININTASDNLLRSIFVHQSDAESLAANTDPSKGFSVPLPLESDTFAAVKERLVVGGYKDFSTLKGDLGDLQLWPKANLGLYSDYFLLQSSAKLGDLELSMESVIYRKDGTISFFARSINGL